MLLLPPQHPANESPLSASPVHPSRLLHDNMRQVFETTAVFLEKRHVGSVVLQGGR